ncbi:MAG: hypothetical protein JXA49_00380 [Actinobacteria bacterium]|nr:hypothetical protein [Actinomycetota bacterium]
MPIDPGLLFSLLQAADRNGVIENGSAFAGEVIQQVLNEPDIDLGDLFNYVDAIKMDTLMKVDKLLGLSGPFLRFAESDLLMRNVARILDSSILRRFMVDMVSPVLARALRGEKKPPSRLILRLKTAINGKTEK